ncbi:hypothetical protein [Geminicoccus harenae]|uniref:hypothetical protein n=1 Tax=Geminicoccus harenae TaxID=2498453 RepID=UPI00168BDBC6|nr:hypothetical protein [Geminicoccus harenae]
MLVTNVGDVPAGKSAHSEVTIGLDQIGSFSLGILTLISGWSAVVFGGGNIT